ncbi:hypothetical protein ACP70R_039532 [Stipagrostis hirtigluma subsp. patula]
MERRRPLPSKLLLALLLLVLAPLLQARMLGGPREERRRRLRSPAMLMLPSDRDGADGPAAKLDAAGPGVGRPGGRVPPAPKPGPPRKPGGGAPPHPYYRHKGAPARRPADVLAVLRDAIVQLQYMIAA